MSTRATPPIGSHQKPSPAQPRKAGDSEASDAPVRAEPAEEARVPRQPHHSQAHEDRSPARLVDLNSCDAKWAGSKWRAVDFSDALEAVSSAALLKRQESKAPGRLAARHASDSESSSNWLPQPLSRVSHSESGAPNAPLDPEFQAALLARKISCRCAPIMTEDNRNTVSLTGMGNDVDLASIKKLLNKDCLQKIFDTSGLGGKVQVVTIPASWNHHPGVISLTNQMKELNIACYTKVV